MADYSTSTPLSTNTGLVYGLIGVSNTNNPILFDPSSVGDRTLTFTAPTGFSVVGSPLTGTGTISLGFSAGYSLPTTASQTNWDTAFGWGNHAAVGYLTSFTETDPVFSAAPASGIVAGDITNWNSAYGWGDHAAAGYLLASTASTTYQPLDGDLTAIGALVGTAGLLRKTAANTWTLDTTTYGTGTVSSVGLVVPTGFSVSGSPVTSSGDLTLNFAAGYALPTTASQTNWDTAYGWGDHAVAGYQSALGFTPENIANKSNSYTVSSTTTYATTKALVDGLAAIKADIPSSVVAEGRRNYYRLPTYARTLDLTSTDASLKGFGGGFTDGRYGYFVPLYNGAYFGKVARVDLTDFSTVSVLDLTLTDTSLKGFIGGFTDGRYGYFVPQNNGAYFGKVARVDLTDFSTVSVLDLTLTDASLKGFSRGFTDGRYGYFVPQNNGAYFGKVARVDLTDFSTVSVLDLTSTDASLKGFAGGFTDGRYGYFVPTNNGAAFGKIARVDLTDFSTVSVLDLASTDSDLKGFIGGFTDGRYGYFVPYNNGAAFGKVARVDLTDFSTVSVLDLTSTDASLKGFVGGFTDGRYGYFVPYYNGAAFGKVARVDLTDFSTVSVLDLTSTDASLKGFVGGFTDGRYGYFVPNNNGAAFGKVARVDLF